MTSLTDLVEISNGLVNTLTRLDRIAESDEMERKIGIDLCLELEKISRENTRLAKEIGEIARMYGG